MYFQNRYDAARQLAQRLQQYKYKDGVVLAIPRGGVPIGHYLAKELDFQLDLLMTKKIGHPSHQEYAIGAVGLEDSIIEDTVGIPEEYLHTAVMNIREQLKKKYRKFMGDHIPISVRGKITIVTDDGVATGRTILATLKMLRTEQPSRLIVAVPVASLESVPRIRKEVDEFVCLYKPLPFQGVGRFYADFSQVEDAEVMALMKDFEKTMK